jgi:glutathione S-transferase
VINPPRVATPILVHLSVSPWSERARWALDHHRIDHQRVAHQPVLGERRLRKLVGRRDGPATVPVLIDGDTKLNDSWDIALWADGHGAGAPLLPDDRRDEIRKWNDLAERVMQHDRALVIEGMLATPEALDESMPPGTPKWLCALSRPINRLGTRWFARKYGVALGDTGLHEAAMRDGLAALRAALATGSPYILGTFSYADIIAATLLQGVVPVADEYMKIGPGTRRAWTHEPMARDHEDLIKWRDDLYRAHRRRQ